MADPGVFSRIGLRLMAWTLGRNRKGLILEERLRRSGVREGQTVLDYACGPGYCTIGTDTFVGDHGEALGS
jgi:ubiquinone/menaquinone biosynthesis C-methylase UbiE